jgi:hypothetical protein
LPLADFGPSGASRVWGLDYDDGPADALRQELTAAAIEQFSSQALHYWLLKAAGDVFDPQSADGIHDQVAAALAGGDHPLIVVREGGSAHAVVAYNIEQLSPHSFYIDVYDSDRPYTTAEDADLEALRANENGSRIEITASGQWYFQEQVGGNHPWSSTNSGPHNLVVLAYGAVPRNPTLPTNPKGALKMIFGSAEFTTATLVDAAGRAIVDGPQASSFVPFGDTLPPTHAFVMEQGRPYTELTTGTKVGTYRNTGAGPGFVVSLPKLATRPGERDALSVAGHTPDVTFRTNARAKALRLAMTVDAAGGAAHTLELAGTARRGATDRVAYDRAGDRFTIAHGGVATTASLRVTTSGGHGLPAAFASGSIRLVGGERLTVTLDRTGAVTVRHRDGRTVRLARRNGHALKALKLQAHGHSLQLTAKLDRKAAGSSLLLVWNLTRGRRIAAHHAETVPATGTQLSRTWTLPPRRPGPYRALVYARVQPLAPADPPSVRTAALRLRA